MRPDHGRGPFDALVDRGFDVTLRARRLDRPVPARPCAATSRRRSPIRPARRRRQRSAGCRGTGTVRPRAGVAVQGVLRRRRRHVRPRRHRRVGDRRARGRPGDGAARRRAGGVDRRRAARRRVLRHGQPGGPRARRARGGPALRAARRVPGPAHPSERVRGLVVGARPVPAGDHIARAAAVATGADVAIVIVGTDDDWETEGEDRTGLALPLDQDELVAAVVAANPNTVVVLNTGSPVTMPWLADAPAVLQLWFPGQEIGDALVDVLTGDVEPGGRLPITYPARLEDTPAFATHPGARGSRRVRRGPVHRPPLVRPRGHRAAVPVRVRARLHDVRAAHGGGQRWRRGRRHRRGRRCATPAGRDGGEVVQVYVEPPGGDPARPVRHLAGFARADVAAGEEATASIELDRRAFASWLDGEWVVPPGEHVIHVGRPQPRPPPRRRGPIPSAVEAVERAATALRTSEPPVDGVEAGGAQGGVGAAEGLGAEEAVVGRQG